MAKAILLKMQNFHVQDNDCLLLLYDAGFQFDYVFDWTVLKSQQSQNASAPPRPIVSQEHVLFFS